MNEEDIVVKYYNKLNVEKIYENEVAEKKEKKNLPEGFFVDEKNDYIFGNNSYSINKEGLYRFFENGKMLKQLCYYENDLPLFMSSLFHCCDFSGESEPIFIYELLNILLSSGDITKLEPITFFNTIMEGKIIPKRQIDIFSPTLQTTLFSWIEIWDEKEESWLLYWTERKTFLGKTNNKRTYVDVFQELVKEFNNFELLAPMKKINSKNFSELKIEERVNKSLETSEEFEKLINDYKAVPVMRPDFSSINAITEIKYEEKFCTENGKDMLLEGKGDRKYKAVFLDKKYIEEKIYGPQIHVMKNKIIRMK